MTFLKISLPVYKKDNWGQLEKNGKIEVSSEVDSLTDGYESLKIQIDNLLSELDAQNRLADDAKNLEREIEQKAYTLQALVSKIEQATKHYENLRLFLERLGVDPTARRLTFDEKFLLQDASLPEIEVLLSDTSEF